MLIPVFFIFLWSSGYLFVETGLLNSNPLLFLSLRLWLAWFVILFIFLFTRSSLYFSSKKIFAMFCVSLFSQVIYQIFFFSALSYSISTGILAIILGMQPILTLLFLKENLIRLQKIGICLGFFGLVLTVCQTILYGSHAILGIVFALFSLMGITLGTIFQKKYCGDIPLTSNLFVQYSFSAVLVSVIFLFVGSFHIIFSHSFVISLLWISWVISVGAIYLFYHLLKKGKATSVTSYFYCVPPVTASFDYVIFRHRLSIVTIIGMLFVIAGLILIHYKNYGLNKIKGNSSAYG